MKKSEDVPQVVLKQEITVVDNPGNSVVQPSVKTINWQQRTLLRLGLGGATVAGVGLLWLLGQSIVLVFTPQKLVISIGAVVGLGLIYALGGFIEGTGAGDYVVRKFAKFFK